MSGTAGLSGVADPDKSTEPDGFSRLNHPQQPFQSLSIIVSVLHWLPVNFNTVSTHVRFVLLTGFHGYAL